MTDMNEKKLNELPCEIVRDLLPIYHDGAVNEVTADAVSCHLENCEDCQREYDMISKEIVPQEKVQPSSKEKFSITMSKSKRRIIISVTAICLLLSFGVYLLMNYLTTFPLVDVDDVSMNIQKVVRYEYMGKSKFLIIAEWEGGYSASYETCNIVKKDNGILELKCDVVRPLITKKYKSHNMDTYDFDVSEYGDINSLMYNGKVIWSKFVNGNDKVPDYVYILETMRFIGTDELVSGNYDDTDLLTYGLESHSLYFIYTSGREIRYDFDGNVLFDGITDIDITVDGKSFEWTYKPPVSGSDIVS